MLLLEYNFRKEGLKSIIAIFTSLHNGVVLIEKGAIQTII